MRYPGWRWFVTAGVVVLVAAAIAAFIRFPEVNCSYITPRPLVPCPQPAHLTERFLMFGSGFLVAVLLVAVGAVITARRGDPGR
jgi:hypothetical protein